MRKKSRWFIGVLAALQLFAVQAPVSAATLYHQPVWFEWDQAALDVLIIPPEHGQVFNGNGPLAGGDVNELSPYENSYLRATEQSIKDWDRAVEEYGADWLKTGLVTNVYVVGRDEVPEAALDDPEIIVASDQHKGVILGVAIRSGGSDGIRCIVDNSKFFTTSFTYEDMYNINGQEYGHCLGLGHVEGIPEDSTIQHDVMNGTYRDTPGAAGVHRHCVSNLNVEGLEFVYAGLFDQPLAPRATMESTFYERLECEPPAPAP